MTLTADRLHSLLHYDPITGIFVWRVHVANIPAGSIAGSVNKRGYRKIQIDGCYLQAHRLAWFYVHGEWPKGELDHKDTAHDHNWISNLRPATSQQNKANIPLRSDNTSGFKGVRFRHGKWRAFIKKDGIEISLGGFSSPELAHAAYAAKAQEFFGEFANCGVSDPQDHVPSSAIVHGDVVSSTLDHGVGTPGSLTGTPRPGLASLGGAGCGEGAE